jgi:hypothetical protein
MTLIQTFDEFKVGDLYTFPCHFQFLFTNRELMLASWKDTFEAAITSKMPDVVSFQADINFFKFLNPKNLPTCKTGGDMFLLGAYQPFIVLEKSKSRQKIRREYDVTYTKMEIIILKILVDENTFWCGFDEALFEQNIVFGYTDEMVGKTYENSYNETDR